MTKKLQVYKCDICGNIVEVLHEDKGELVCCGQPMKLLKEQTEEQGKEKHMPVVERIEKGVRVKVGSIPHSMEEKHYIEWIEVVSSDRIMSRFLKPGDTPEAKFEIDEAIVEVREYCTIHGLWKTEI